MNHAMTTKLLKLSTVLQSSREDRVHSKFPSTVTYPFYLKIHLKGNTDLDFTQMPVMEYTTLLDAHSTIRRQSLVEMGLLSHSLKLGLWILAS